MNKIRKLLIPALFLFLTLSGMTVMESSAEETQGEQASAGSALEDENPQRLEEVTGMDEEGNIYEVDDSEGTVEQPKLRTFSRAASVQVVNFRTQRLIIRSMVPGLQVTRMELTVRMRHTLVPTTGR